MVDVSDSPWVLVPALSARFIDANRKVIVSRSDDSASVFDWGETIRTES